MDLRNINNGRKRGIPNIRVGVNGNDPDKVYAEVIGIMEKEPFIGLKPLCEIIGHNPSTLSRFYRKIRSSGEWVKWVKEYQDKGKFKWD